MDRMILIGCVIQLLFRMKSEQCKQFDDTPWLEMGSQSQAICSTPLLFDSRQKSLLDAVEAASTQNSRDHSARRTRVAETHIPATRVPVDGHLGDERDTDTRRNHSKEAAELAALERDARRNTSSCTRCDAEVAEAVAIAQHDEGLSAKIFEGKRFGSGEGMIPG